MSKTIRCIHRHDIHHHPGCFKSGKVVEIQAEAYPEKAPRGIRVNVKAKNDKPWWQQEGTRIGYLDIETDNLNADFGTMLSWAIKEKDGKVRYEQITQKELMNGSTDLRLLKLLIEEIKKYDIIVTYYGTGFDVPYIRTKSVYWQQILRTKGASQKEIDSLDFPVHGAVKHFDLYYTVKSKFKLSRNRLATVTEYFGIAGKTPLKGETWNKAKYGDSKALKEIKEHNIGDVVILEELHELVVPFRQWARKSV